MSHEEFAPYHIVRTDVPRAQGMGKFYDLGVAAATLDFLRRQFPDQEYCILDDGGVIDDSRIVRKATDTLGTVATFKRLPNLKIVRRAA